jgi:alcohol dehydrogenase class IV
MTTLDELEAIRARHGAANAPNGNITAIQWRLTYGGDAHADRATLLRLLDAAREELREVREALGDAHGELCAGQRLAMQLSDWSIDAERCMERARAALAKDATTETKP